MQIFSSILLQLLFNTEKNLSKGFNYFRKIFIFMFMFDWVLNAPL